MPRPDNPKRITFEVSAETHQRFMLACAIRGQSIADIMRELVETVIKETEDKIHETLGAAPHHQS